MRPSCVSQTVTQATFERQINVVLLAQRWGVYVVESPVCGWMHHQRRQELMRTESKLRTVETDAHIAWLKPNDVAAFSYVNGIDIVPVVT